MESERFRSQLLWLERGRILFNYFDLFSTVVLEYKFKTRKEGFCGFVSIREGPSSRQCLFPGFFISETHFKNGFYYRNLKQKLTLFKNFMGTSLCPLACFRQFLASVWDSRFWFTVDYMIRWLEFLFWPHCFYLFGNNWVT